MMRLSVVVFLLFMTSNTTIAMKPHDTDSVHGKIQSFADLLALLAGKPAQGDLDIRIQVQEDLSLEQREAVLQESMQWLREHPSVAARITRLELQDNFLQQVPVALLALLPNLVYLNLGDNRIRDIPAGAFQLNTKLQELRIYSNRLVVIAKNVFTSPSLFYIDLSSNNIREIDPEAFAQAINMQLISLLENHITAPVFAAVQWPASIEGINVGENNITELPSGLFGNNSKLQKLYLQRNGLTRLDYSTLANITNLIVLDLQDDPVDWQRLRLPPALWNRYQEGHCAILGLPKDWHPYGTRKREQSE
ncbi:leucine-rich repeat protein [Candidatus Dependentiae bacterium]|nr:leucine-rich repeat protein [Candidatus Dependentiae bacterium]